MKRAAMPVFLLALLLFTALPAAGQEHLVGHWKLAGDTRDASGHDRHAVNHGVKWDAAGNAVFDGRDAWLEVPARQLPALGTGSFSVAAWIHTDQQLDDVLGDVMTCYDPRSRNGFTLSLMNYAGVTSAQSNWRNILFGIDAGQVDEKWTDRGRPGNNHHIKALAVYQDHLYAGTWEPAASESGHVYRYAGGTRWVDCGAPDKSNAITSLAVYQGKLYAGSELYSGAGSSLPVSPNTNNGGSVFRYEGDQKWTNVGKVADVRSISGLTVYKGKLYAGTGTTGAWRDKPRTRGMYRYDGIGKWTSCGCPDLRVVHLGVYNGDLLAMSYDAGGFFRYDGGTKWTRLGPVPESTQAYSMAVYEGKVHVGTWPTGSVFQYDGPQKWTHRGRLGQEKEVMGMSVYNGKLYAGTLPYADVYRYEGGSKWVTTGRLDNTPDVRYRRAWVMAVFQGKLFCGVLPSGHVLSLEAGKSVTLDRALPAGWQHLAAVKSADTLKLYVNGKLVSSSSTFAASRFNLQPNQPLKIGFGQHDYFNGKMQDVRLYAGALDETAIRMLATPRR
ncbi:MAG: LamG domain-containing protein [Pirellulaceae bacterium]